MNYLSHTLWLLSGWELTPRHCSGKEIGCVAVTLQVAQTEGTWIKQWHSVTAGDSHIFLKCCEGGKN